MWLFTEDGFVSAVVNSKNPNVISVRGRDKRSVAAVASATGQPILRSPNGDYPYRVFVTREQFANWVFTRAMDLDYRNFKGRVHEVRGATYARELNRVWSVMLDTEDDDSREGNTGDVIEVIL